MVEAGKGYTVKVPDGAGYFTEYKRGIVLIDYECVATDKGIANFRPIDYEGNPPDGKAQGIKSVFVPITETSLKDFHEVPELTEKIQAGVLSSKP